MKRWLAILPLMALTALVLGGLVLRTMTAARRRRRELAALEAERTPQP